ncbi:putative cyclin-J-like [Daphnia sinensis]|uniref:Cyclin-J-like n=1 Tax=Daphnia sinensis TaxID=1820382 RepID=A0AAD5PYX1_9CRUS|nr:putative cyclin-J-like [Daphnia sinensis]
MARHNSCDDETFPYNHEYYALLRFKENERFYHYQFQARSPQLNDKLGLSLSTFHLAVHLLDIFMDCHEIDQQQLMLAGSTCLLIAAKYVDVDSNVPKFSHLQSLTNHHNSIHEFSLMEKMLLNFWKWDLNFSTTLDFLEHYLSCDLKCAEGLHSNSLKNLKCQAVYLANLTLSEVNFIYFKSSVIAASCILVARLQFRLLPTWPEGMEILTGYSYLEIDECVQLLIHLAQIMQSECFFNPALQQQSSILIREEPKVECKYKLKGVSNHNCARTKRRHLIHPRDLKQMYRLTDCAM